jgi:hypothetical protein
MAGGSNIDRHPWFVSRVERIVAALIPDAVLHRSVTQNYGLLGGFLDCIFWTYPDGSPTRLTVSSWRSER